MFMALASRGLWCPPTVNVAAAGVVDCIHTVASTPIVTLSLAAISGTQSSTLSGAAGGTISSSDSSSIISPGGNSSLDGGC